MAWVIDMMNKKNLHRILHSRILWILILNAILIIIPVTGYYFIQSRNYQANRIWGIDVRELNRSIIESIEAGYSFDIINYLPLPSPYQRFILIDSTNNKLSDSLWLGNDELINFEYDFFLLTMANSFIEKISEPELDQEEILQTLSPYINLRENRHSIIDYRFTYYISHFSLEDGSELSLITLVDKLDILYAARLWKIVLLFVSLISFAVAIIVSTVYYRLIIKPLIVLTKEVKLIMEFEKSPAKIFSMKDRKDEIGILSKAFHNSALELIHKKESIETFTSDVLHELKNPLTAIRNGIEILQNRENQDNLQSDENEILSILYRESGRIEKLLFDIREYSLFNQDLDSEEGCNPEIIIKEVLSLYSDAGIKLNIPDDNYPKVKLSREKLVCILTNLIDNALDFSPEFGSVAIEYYQENGFSILAVIDEGSGIPDSEKEKIYTRFYTNRQNAALENLHSGLGLSIVQKILKNAKHSIWCEDNTSTGCSFFIKFNP